MQSIRKYRATYYFSFATHTDTIVTLLLVLIWSVRQMSWIQTKKQRPRFFFDLVPLFVVIIVSVYGDNCVRNFHLYRAKKLHVQFCRNKSISHIHTSYWMDSPTKKETAIEWRSISVWIGHGPQSLDVGFYPNLSVSHTIRVQTCPNSSVTLYTNNQKLLFFLGMSILSATSN